MAKNLGEFLKELAKKSGLNVEDDSVKAFFTTESFTGIDVPETVFKPIETSLISISDAKNNHQDIKNHYTKQALYGLDKNIDALMDSLGLTDDQKNEIKVERSSYKRPELLIKQVQRLEQEKANAGKPNQQAIQKQIDDLHAQLRVATEKENQLKADFAQKEKDLRLTTRVESLIMPHKTIHDTLSPEVKNTIIKTLINQELQDKSAKFDFDENGNVVLLRKDGTNYFGDNNQTITPKQFVEQVLSRNKQLVVNASGNNNGQNNAANQQNGQQQSGAPAGGSGNSDKKGASATFKEIMGEALKDATQTTSTVLGN